MKKCIIINNLLINIDSMPDESEEMFYDRVNFILSKMSNTQINLNDLNDLNDLINISKIYSNIKYKKCLYSDEIMKLSS
jgi:flagellar biosynthesis regulator FlbT